ncbi:hypothetical protein GGF31_006630 [Allomyces arbusculus]|nr:hypothetical protein GGF31_006630 [Allomyces arbusculus]
MTTSTAAISTPSHVSSPPCAETARIKLLKTQLTAEQEQAAVFNWAHTRVLATNDQVRRPRTVAELQALVRAHTHVRPVGSRLTYEALTCVAESGTSVLVDLSAMPSGLVNMDPVTHEARFWAGTTVEGVANTLRQHGRALDCSPGVIGVQTLAGAIGTGTHGQGLGQAFVGDSVVQIDLVRAVDGALVRIGRGSALLDAARLHLGVLGVVVQITLRTQPLRILTCTKATIAVDDFVQSFVDVNRREEYVKAWWFPNTDLVHVWAASPASARDIATWRAAGGNQVVDVEAASEDRLASTIRDLEAKMARDTCDDQHGGRQFETVARFKRAVSVTGTMQQVYMKGIPVPQINCEIAVPLARFHEAVAALQTWLRHTTHQLHYPFIFRCTGASSAWLAPHPGQELCYIGFLVYLSKDGTATPGSFDLMHELQAVLAPLGGAPHWGKHMALDGMYAWHELFPQIPAFAALMDEWDPMGKWQNAFTRDLFAAVPRALVDAARPQVLAWANSVKVLDTAPSDVEGMKQKKRVIPPQLQAHL